jgi:hypothetical protein
MALEAGTRIGLGIEWHGVLGAPAQSAEDHNSEYRNGTAQLQNFLRVIDLCTCAAAICHALSQDLSCWIECHLR